MVVVSTSINNISCSPHEHAFYNSFFIEKLFLSVTERFSNARELIKSGVRDRASLKWLLLYRGQLVPFHFIKCGTPLFVTSLATPTHWEFSMSILKLKV